LNADSVSADRLHPSLEEPFRHSRRDVPQLHFEGSLSIPSASAATLLNGPQKSKEIEERNNEQGAREATGRPEERGKH